MSNLTEQRIGEIAMTILIEKLEKEGGLTIGSKFHRELGDIAKKIGIPIEELEEFSKEVLVRFIGRTFGMQHVSLTMNDPIKRPEKK
jgi:hypothetical protein